MFLKNFVVAAVFAVGSLTATMSTAATCTVGTCTVNEGVDGDLLSDGVLINLSGIVNDALTNTFEFSGTFINDTIGNGDAVATVLQFAPSSLGNILNLTFDIIAPASVAPQSFAITDATGASVAGPNMDVPFVIDLLGADANAVISYVLHGTAVPSDAGSKPGLNVEIVPSVPLPAGVLLMGTALAGFGVMRRRRKS